jgi:Ca2+-binding RTX toxin-like protein
MTNTKTHYTQTQDLAVYVSFAAIQGTAAGDNLRGTKGADTLDGLGGDDKLAGGTGLDTFHISAGSDTISDFNRIGNDWGNEILQVEAGAKVVATLAADPWTATADSYNLGVAELRTSGLDVDLSAIIAGQGWSIVDTGKNATLTGSRFGDVLTAGSGNDTLNGGDGDDLLIGKMYADTMTGGAGADRFRLDGKGDLFAHTITDFESGVDRIELKGSEYTKLGLGAVPVGALAYGTSAQTREQHLIYDRDSGQLLYDADGSGGGKPTLIGILEPWTHLLASDLWVV